jgi:hypothetical protein
MSNFYNDFMSKYRVKHVQVSRDRDYRTINYGTYNQTASYYADREEIIEMEITRDGFEHLVKLDREYDNIWEQQRNEAYLRRTYPAVAEAYDKYRMLLELYK